MQRSYVTPDGKKYPVYEAGYQYTVYTYKSDCRKAVIGDPEQCLIARGAKRDKSVKAAFIGSGGDAYILFRGKPNAAEARMREDHVLHFVIPAKSARVRDYFDTHKKAKTMALLLLPPTEGRTLEHRAKLGKKRRDGIKAGTHVVKPRGTPAKSRIMRIGVEHRPKAIIEKNVIRFPDQDKAA